MENQHREISGYRDLTHDEIDLMNEVKDIEAKVLSIQKRIMRQLSAQEESGTPEDKHRLQEALAHRWAQIARPDLEKGFMALVRAVAQPQPREE